MERCISMSTKELERYEHCLKLEQRLITQLQVADILGITTRQVKRLFKSYKKHGPKGLVSKKRGGPSNNRAPCSLTTQVVKLIEAHYSDFGPTLAHEKLLEVHKLKISLGSVRNLMVLRGLWEPSKVKRKKIFQLRERRGSKGELIQLDGSPHAWFEERGPKCSLLVAIDDATGEITGRFVPSESTWSYFEFMREYLTNHGIPRALYVDKHAVFKVNHSGALSGTGLTDFGRAMKELGIELIYANSPQAKGRVERSNRTLQDRLVKELRLQNISNMEEANAFLPLYYPDLNRRFAVVAKNPNNAHKPLTAEYNLDLIFTEQQTRSLSKDLMLQYKNVIYQIVSDSSTYVLRKARVTVCEDKEGSLRILYKGKELDFVIYSQQEKQGEIVDSKNLNKTIDRLQDLSAKKVHKPGYHHPWKRSANRRLLKKS